MKIYKEYAKETFSFLVNNTTLKSANPLRFRNNLLWMSTNKKIKVINNKIEQRNAQYDLHRQTAKISALSLGNVSKYEFLTRTDFLP